MKRNIKDLFWKNMVRERKNVYGIEGAVITPEEVWKASGHLENFADPMTEDKTTHHRFRLDTLIEDQLKIPT
jgi:glycyl-tRNA synthetase